MQRFNYCWLFLIIMPITIFAQDSGRWGISISATKGYLMDDEVTLSKILSNDPEIWRSNIGISGEWEFFMSKHVTFFLNVNRYEFVRVNEELQYTLKNVIIPYFNGIRLYLGAFYVSFAGGFMRLEQSISSDFFQNNNSPEIFYSMGTLWGLGLRINVSSYTSLHFYGKYVRFENLKYTLWGIGLSPSIFY